MATALYTQIHRDRQVSNLVRKRCCINLIRFSPRDVIPPYCIDYDQMLLHPSILLKGNALHLNAPSWEFILLSRVLKFFSHFKNALQRCTSCILQKRPWHEESTPEKTLHQEQLKTIQINNLSPLSMLRRVSHEATKPIDEGVLFRPSMTNNLGSSQEHFPGVHSVAQATLLDLTRTEH